MKCWSRQTKECILMSSQLNKDFLQMLLEVTSKLIIFIVTKIFTYTFQYQIFNTVIFNNNAYKILYTFKKTISSIVSTGNLLAKKTLRN